MNIFNNHERTGMRKPSESHKETKDADSRKDAAPQASTAAKPAVKAWPFAPGSQLDQQVAKPWTPKPSYRFNQR